MCVCVHAPVSMGVCHEILVHTGVCSQLGLRVSQSQEATKEELLKELKPLDRRRGSQGRQGHSCRGFRVRHKGENVSYGTIHVGLCLGSATDQTCDPGQVTYLCGLPFAHE